MSFAESPLNDRYESVVDGDEVELRVQASRFFAQVFQVSSEEAAKEHLAELRRRYHDATHHCSAWRLGSPEECLERCDDDGEPSQTAGRPILTALQHEKLFDALVVVTRYFGGTKLGTGGLIRAYGGAAATAVKSCPRRELIHRVRLLTEVEFDDVGRVEAVLGRHGDRVLCVDRSFSEHARFEIDIFRSCAEFVDAALVEATAGRARIQKLTQLGAVERKL